MKEQLEFGHRLLNEKGLVPKLEMGPCSTIDERVLTSLDGQTEMILPLDFQTESVQVPWIEYKGTTFNVGNFVAYRGDDCDRLVFAVIEALVCNSSMKVKMMLRCCHTLTYNEKMCSYLVERTEVFKFASFEELSSFLPCLHVATSDGAELVSPRHAL